MKVTKVHWPITAVLGAAILFLQFACSQAVATVTVPDDKVVDLGNGIIQEPVTGRMWQKERSQSFATYDEAREYAEQLELGGYTDWRLPTVYELYDLHYLFDLKKGRGVAIKLEGNYWSGEKDGEGMVGSWEIGDQCEPERQYFGKNRGYVRVVRP